jgi:hypothetical protein
VLKLSQGDIMTIKKDVCYGKQEEQKLDVYLPEKKDFTTVIYIHGGGIESGDKTFESHIIIPPMIKEGYAVVSVNYRMYPKAKFPEFIIDAALAVKWVKDNIVSLGGNGKIFISGHSAGAYISLMLCLDQRYLLRNGILNKEIKGWFIDSPQTTTHFNVLKERNEDPRLERIDEGAPLYFVNADTKFNSMALILYDDDMPVRYEQDMLFYKSILNFNKDADITYKVLSGKHCVDLYENEANGNAKYINLLIEYIKSKE